MSGFLEALVARAGHYRGEGKNHDDQTFIGRLELSPIIRGLGVQIAFSATGLDGEVYHEEVTLVAPGQSGEPSLVTLCSNAPGLLTLPIRTLGTGEDDETTAVFGLGAREDLDAFRMEIAFDLWPGGDMTYRFGWGLPGDSFEPRSSVRMRTDHKDLAVPS
mgnify:CR=1 FL=1|jgi:hypothetical protein